MIDDTQYKNLCYHSHNLFCDGKNYIEEVIQSAIEQDIKHLGISSHAPLKISTPWSILHNKLINYSSEIDKLSTKYSEKISVYKSLEIDYIPNFTYSFDYFRDKLKLDYTIGSIHLVRNPENNKLWFIDGDQKKCRENLNIVFNGNIQQAITSYYHQFREMIVTQKPDIIGHLDKVIMNTQGLLNVENEAWYLDEVSKTIELISKNGCILEVNTRGLYKKKWNTSFPSPDLLRMANQLNIPIIISSDAHHSNELLGSYQKAKEIALSCGYTHVSMFDNGKWKPIELK